MILDQSQYNTAPVANVKEKSASKLARNVQILELYNRAAFANRLPAVDISEYEKSFYTEVKEKGLDGTTTVARGTGLLQTNYQNQMHTMIPLGGVWEQAGAEVIRDVSGAVVQFLGHYNGIGSGYQPLSTAAAANWAALTAVTNDQPGQIRNEQTSLLGYVVETFIRKAVLQGFLGDADAIINLYERNFMEKDLLHDDELATDSIVLNANIAGSASAGATVGNIVQTFLNMRSKLQAKGAKRVDVHLNADGLNQMLSAREGGTSGQFLLFNVGNGDTATFTPVRNADGSDKESGLVGMLQGSRVYLNNGIRNTYTPTGNNITAVTGGSNTAMIVGDSRLLGLGIGKNDLNETTVIANTEQTFRTGTIIVGRTRFAGATPIMPDAFGYFTFPASA
jgi:hypothetical protein